MKLSILLLPLLLLASPAKEWKALSDTQKSEIIADYNYGKTFDVGYSLAAINWQESSGCKYQIGELTGDYGCYHINLKYHLLRNTLDDNQYNRSAEATKLVVDRAYSRSIAIEQILFWNKVARGKWFVTWGMYNAGYAPNLTYARNVANKVMFLKTILDQ